MQDTGVALLAAAPPACSLTVPTHRVGTVGVLVTNVGLSAEVLPLISIADPEDWRYPNLHSPTGQ